MTGELENSRPLRKHLSSAGGKHPCETLAEVNIGEFRNRTYSIVAMNASNLTRKHVENP